jgi:mannosylglycerate hydrolase MGH1-like protein
MTLAVAVEPDHRALDRLARDVMNQHWRPAGRYTSPNPEVYPWQELWDSCFHAIIWGALGEGERALEELAAVFAFQQDDGFVPDCSYPLDPDEAIGIWGQRGFSPITEPPMFAHAAAELTRMGIAVPAGLIERCARGLAFLWERRMGHSGLVRIVHPWEAGTDDTPRWDAWRGTADRAAWGFHKRALITSLERTPVGSAIANRDFEVCPASFNALCAFNAIELGELIGDASWIARGRALAERIDRLWDDVRCTWIDHADRPRLALRAPTLEALFPVLVSSRGDHVARAWERVFDPDHFGAPFGPRQVARHWPTYDPDAYWRGPTWPQLNYILWVAARRARPALAQRLAHETTLGALTSGFAEYWHPDTGQPRGAQPQSSTGLVVHMARGVGL